MFLFIFSNVLIYIQIIKKFVNYNFFLKTCPKILTINNWLHREIYLCRLWILAIFFFNTSIKIIILSFFILFKLFYILIKKIIKFSYLIPNLSFNFIFLTQSLATLFLNIFEIFIFPKFACLFNFRLLFIFPKFACLFNFRLLFIFIFKNFRNRIILLL